MGSTVELVIKMIDQTSGGSRGVIGSFTEIKSAIGLAQQGFEILQRVYDETGGKAVSYANDVRQVMEVSGQSAEETSRMIQVLDDYKISTDDMMAATRKLTQQGLAPNIDTLAKLADQYVSLNSIEDKNKLIMDNLGRSGFRYVELMKQGGDAIRKRAAATEQGLIMDERALAQARIYEFQLDALNDKILALKITAGRGVLGLLTGETVDVQRRSQELFKQAYGYEINTNALKRYSPEVQTAYEAMRILAEKEWLAKNGMDGLTGSIDPATQALIDQEQAAKSLSDRLTTQLGVISNIGSENKNFAKTQADLKAQIDELIKKGWSPLSDKVKDLKAQYAENAAEHKRATDQILYDLLLQKLSVDGLTSDEYNMAIQFGLSLGIYDQTSAKIAQDFDQVTTAVQTGKAKIEDVQRILDLMKQGYSIDVAINILNSEGLKDLWGGLAGGNTTRPKKKSQNQQFAFAAGGSFTVPSEYGYEGFDLGGIATASAGEQISVVPPGGGYGSKVVNLKVIIAGGFADPQAAARQLKPAFQFLLREAGLS